MMRGLAIWMPSAERNRNSLNQISLNGEEICELTHHATRSPEAEYHQRRAERALLHPRALPYAIHIGVILRLAAKWLQGL